MLKALANASRVFTNLSYLVPVWVRRFESRNLGERVIVAGAAKARKMKEPDSQVRYEAGWVVSKRGVAMLTESRLTCAGWDIPLKSIKKARLLRVRQMALLAYALQVSTETDNYQFGLMYDERWEQQSVLDLEIEDSTIKYSVYSIAARMIFVAVVIWWLIERFA